MSSDVTAAVLERLVGSLPSDVMVYDGTVLPNPPARYVVVYGDVGLRSAAAVDGLSRDQSFTVQCTCAVTAPMAAGHCRWLAGTVRDLLTDFLPVVDGVTPGQFTHSVSRRPVPNETVPDRHTWESVEQFSLLAGRST